MSSKESNGNELDRAPLALLLRQRVSIRTMMVARRATRQAKNRSHAVRQQGVSRRESHESKKKRSGSEQKPLGSVKDARIEDAVKVRDRLEFFMMARSLTSST